MFYMNQFRLFVRWSISLSRSRSSFTVFNGWFIRIWMRQLSVHRFFGQSGLSFNEYTYAFTNVGNNSHLQWKQQRTQKQNKSIFIVHFVFIFKWVSQFNLLQCYLCLWFVFLLLLFLLSLHPSIQYAKPLQTL